MKRNQAFLKTSTRTTKTGPYERVLEGTRGRHYRLTQLLPGEK